MSACPICKRPAAPRAQNTAFPFCSQRCKQIDLAKWLTGDYRIPTNELPDETSNVDNSLAAGNRKETPS
jgi:endogenous inhibitor of DNA gyrase (YacG/DUF329 family)